MLGGISVYEVTETTDKSPERVALIQKVTLTYLRQKLLGDGSAWSAISATLANADGAAGELVTKSE